MPEQLDEVLTTLKLAGIRVIDREEVEAQKKAGAKDGEADTAFRTNDPVRVYLRKRVRLAVDCEGEVELPSESRTASSVRAALSIARCRSADPPAIEKLSKRCIRL